MVEWTSRMAWERLVASGKIRGRRLQALTVLYEKGPHTAMEVSVLGRCPGLWKRLSELERMGYVSVIGARRCTVTEETAKVWAAKIPGLEQAELFG